MATQVGPLVFTGTIDGLIFYKLGDKYYTRSKGSYKSAKHMRRNPRYKRTMQQADRFGEAAKRVGEVYYRHLPKEVRKHGLFGKLTGMANRWLFEGKSRQETETLLIAYCKGLVQTAASRDTTEVLSTVAAIPTLANTIEEPVLVNTPKGRPVKKTTHRVKQARYLSRWKVKPNGCLTLPESTKEKTVVVPIQCYPNLLVNLQREVSEFATNHCSIKIENS